MQKITLLGNLGRDPEERHTANGHKVVTFSLAVSPRKDQTVWYDCQIWGKRIELFEKMLPYLKKGSRVLVFGNFRTPETYQAKDGQTKIRLQMEADSIQFVGVPVAKEENNNQETNTYPEKSSSPDVIRQMETSIYAEEIPF